MPTRKLIVSAGNHARRYTPASFDLGEDAAETGALTCDGEAVPCQVYDGRLHFIVDKLAAGRLMGLVFEEGASPGGVPTVSLRHRKRAKQVKIKVGSRKFSTYHFGTEYARPFFHPFIGPQGVQLTRNYPMEKDVEGETIDHLHHRSVWVAYGDVNGSDNWSEGENHAWQAHKDIAELVDGPAFGQFRQTLDWQDHERNKVLEETRTVRVYMTPNSARVMELTVALRASENEVRLGDTKEGGICSVRVATEMDGNAGGRIENSAGGIGEAETWGKPAHWCDYSGTVKGKPVGIAVFDHPFNLRHPTTWHVRNYGLMTANPFGHSYYKSGFLEDGSYTIEAGDTLTFRYRLFIHSHDARRAKVAERYHDYVHPPRVEETS